MVVMCLRSLFVFNFFFTATNNVPISELALFSRTLYITRRSEYSVTITVVGNGYDEFKSWTKQYVSHRANTHEKDM